MKSEDIVVSHIEVKNGRNVKIGAFLNRVNGIVYNDLYRFRNSIRPMKLKEYYDTYLKSEDEGCCHICGNKTNFHNVIDGYRRFCSDACAGKDEYRISKIKNRFVDNIEKLELYRKNSKETLSKTSNIVLKERERKRIETCKNRYGDNYFSERTKRQWKNRSKSDIDNLVKKSNETKLKNGTTEINSYRNCNKKIELNGKIFHCQGYENIILEFLVNECLINVDDICTGKYCPRIEYDGNLSGNYRPDIYIKSYQLYIEVKSNWTFFGNEYLLNENIRKQNSALDKNFKHVIIVLLTDKMTNEDKNIFKDILDMAIRSQAYEFNRTVQRLDLYGKYNPIAFGVGSAKHPKWMMR